MKQSRHDGVDSSRFFKEFVEVSATLIPLFTGHRDYDEGTYAIATGCARS